MSLVFPSTLDLDTGTRSKYCKDVSACRHTDQTENITSYPEMIGSHVFVVNDLLVLSTALVQKIHAVVSQ